MKNIEKLKKEIDGEKGTFLMTLRAELRWDWGAFYGLTHLMYEVAVENKNHNAVDKYIAQGYWFIDTWVKTWTMHENFPRPQKEKYDQALELLHDLCYFFFTSESPYEDGSLKAMAANKKPLSGL